MKRACRGSRCPDCGVEVCPGYRAYRDGVRLVDVPEEAVAHVCTPGALVRHRAAVNGAHRRDPDEEAPRLLSVGERLTYGFALMMAGEDDPADPTPY